MSFLGVIPQAVADIFDFIETHEDKFIFKVTVSFMELYQEQCYDLLSGKERGHSIIEIREDINKGVHLPGNCLYNFTLDTHKKVVSLLVSDMLDHKNPLYSSPRELRYISMLLSLTGPLVFTLETLSSVLVYSSDIPKTHKVSLALYNDNTAL